MSDPFGKAEALLLKRHLEATVAVEAFTIPLYLTAVYSFTERALGYSPDGKYFPLYHLQQNALGVAVQEMYHLQLASNLCNAFHVAPVIPKMHLEAGADLLIPHVQEDDGRPLVARLGTLASMLPTFIEIEEPAEEPYPPPNEAVVYPSIAELYFATLKLLDDYTAAFTQTATTLDPHFFPDEKQIAYGAFASTYRYNKVASRPLVAKVASAITDQGEGNVVAAGVGEDFQAAGPGDVLPEFQPRPGTRFAPFSKRSHYARFEEITRLLESEDWPSLIGGPVFYEADERRSADLPSWAADYPTLERAVGTLWSYLLDVMQAGAGSGQLAPSSGASPAFGDVMLSFKYLLPQCFQWGRVPSFAYRAGVTAKEAQDAMDAVDPLCLFHWDAKTAAIRATHPKNACQGLNDCAGKGWGGIATTKGNGACATADMHTCGANNACSLQGGCGFLMSRSGESCGSGPVGELFPPSELWIPGSNSCRGHGGCQTPISTEQVFNRSAAPQIEGQTGTGWTSQAKAKLLSLRGESVWERARAVFAIRQGLDWLPEPLAKKDGSVEYDGEKRRRTIAPTSK